jgi:nitrate reductase gamma subunit
MGWMLAALAYLALAAFILRVCWRFILLIRVKGEENEMKGSGKNPFFRLGALADIFFLLRLFRANPRLWLGEWLFHASFVVLILWHLRFLVEPVPLWVWRLHTVGKIAAYVFLFSIGYILFIRLAVERNKYIPRNNLFLFAAVFLIGLTGFFIRNFYPADLVEIKNFMAGIFCFAPARGVPASRLFLVHFALVLLFLINLPSHIFAAPLSILEARKREGKLRSLLHA